MRSLAREHGAEALIGLLVVLVAIWFGWYAFQRTGGGRVSNAIQVSALFPNAGGINAGTDVRVAGIKIGQVSDVKLDPKTFQAQVTLAIDPNSKLPDDSSAAVASEGILGGHLHEPHSRRFLDPLQERRHDPRHARFGRSDEHGSASSSTSRAETAPRVRRPPPIRAPCPPSRDASACRRIRGPADRRYRRLAGCRGDPGERPATGTSARQR